MVGPIDIIFCWVDGSDPVWRERFLSVTGQESLSPRQIERYSDNGELRHSLRSLSRHAPWVRSIIVVHDDSQVPAWLDTRHPKIRLVAHSEIVPKQCLPTFSSTVIESHLHRISGLSEHFIYSNDDTLFLRDVRPGDFFDPDGKVIVRLSGVVSPFGPPNPADEGWVCSQKNANRLLDRVRREPERRMISHVHYPTRIDICRKAWEMFGDDLEGMNRDRLRSSLSIAFLNHLVPHLAWYEGAARRSRVVLGSARDVDAGVAGTLAKGLGLVREPLSGFNRILSFVLNRRKVFCVNKGAPEKVRAVLHGLFPDRCEFEREAEAPEGLRANGMNR